MINKKRPNTSTSFKSDGLPDTTTILIIILWFIVTSILFQC